MEESDKIVFILNLAILEPSLILPLHWRYVLFVIKWDSDLKFSFLHQLRKKKKRGFKKTEQEIWKYRFMLLSHFLGESQRFSAEYK